MNQLERDDFTIIENAFWENTSDLSTATSQLRKEIIDSWENQTTTSNQYFKEADVTSFSYGAIIQYLLAIQSFNLEPRNHNTSSGDSEKPIQRIKYHGRKFTLQHTYKTEKDSHTQPGNCMFREITNGIQILRYTERPSEQYTSPAYRLLFFIEIVRRKAVDFNRQPELEDPHRNLPVGLGICMMYELRKHNHIRFKEFWCNDGKYHMFTGDNDTRWQGFTTIWEKYYSIYLNDDENKNTMMEHLRKLMNDFYNPSENSENDNDNLNDLFNQLQV